MTISMYQASVPRLVNMLTNLSAILDKAQAHVDAKKIDATALTAFRLFPDMLSLTSRHVSKKPLPSSAALRPSKLMARKTRPS